MEKECIICGKAFEGNRKSVFCSDDCKNKEELSDDTVAPPIKEKIKMVVTKKGTLELKPSDEKMKELKLTMDKINKDYGAGSVMCLGDEPMKGVEAISTGSLLLNEALGIGGLPKGRIVEIYGPESSGKTTVALHVIAEAQKREVFSLS